VASLCILVATFKAGRLIRSSGGAVHHCRLRKRGLVSFTFLIALSMCPSLGAAQSQVDLTGVWTSDDGGSYFVHQVGNVVWWLGWAPANATDFHKGIQFTNVFRGIIAGNNSVSGEWADVPRVLRHMLHWRTLSSSTGTG
jgi:hypothetical protein